MDILAARGTFPRNEAPRLLPWKNRRLTLRKVRCFKDKLSPVAKLETELQQAIQSEDYPRAARLRDQLRVLHEDSLAAVLAANASFYRAFETGDLAAMRRIWAKGDNVQCIHPGAGKISGHDMVMASWEVMLGPNVPLPLSIEMDNVEVNVKGDLAYVSCLEIVRAGSSWGKQIATNVFERQEGGVWKICMHHASHTGET